MSKPASRYAFATTNGGPQGICKSGRRAFVCACGRVQPYAAAGEPGGLNELEAQVVGWRLVKQGRGAMRDAGTGITEGAEGVWSCPFCSGNARSLKKVFEGKR